MNKKFHIYKDSFCKHLADEKFRYFFQLKLLCILLGGVSFTMGIMNIITHKTVLMVMTMSFAAICCANYILLCIVKRSNFISYAIFDVSVILLFVYFLYTGGTAGFSPHWILLLPTCGMILLGRKHGFIISVIMLAFIIFFLWTPIGVKLLAYNYSPEFCMRFPVVYIAFFVIGYSFELMSSAAYSEMLRVQSELADIAEKDALTGLKNRYWFNKRFFADYDNQTAEDDCLALLIDIDDFKYINDTYSHPAGDSVLCHLSDTVRSCLKESDMLCRWGGEEFFAFVPKCTADEAGEICEMLRRSVEMTNYEYGRYTNMNVTISIGAVHIARDSIMNIEKILCEADKKLYESKDKGKNTVSISREI